MFVLSIKVPIRKKSGNLFNDPRIFRFVILLCVVYCDYTRHRGYLLFALLLTYVTDYF